MLGLRSSPASCAEVGVKNSKASPRCCDRIFFPLGMVFSVQMLRVNKSSESSQDCVNILYSRWCYCLSLKFYYSLSLP